MLTYKVMCRIHSHPGHMDDDDYICEFDGISYQNREDAEFSLMYAKEFCSNDDVWINEEDTDAD